MSFQSADLITRWDLRITGLKKRAGWALWEEIAIAVLVGMGGIE